MRIRAPKDFWSGVMFCAFAAVGILTATGYSLGTAGKMGPGYFPLLLGGVLGILGAILIARSLALDGEGLGAVWGEQTARRMLAEAGFRSVEMHRIEEDILNAYYVATR